MIATAVSLFDGIGGFPLALSRAGVPTVATVEIDAAASGVTQRQLPAHKHFTDVREVTGDNLIAAGFTPETGILTAGWPCQGNSVAGRRAGLADPRSGLWSEVVRLLRESRPRWFLGENVPGLLTVNGGLDFWLVKESLEELGYGLAWRVLDAQHFGVPQRRRRVFLVGSLGDGAGPVEVLFEPESGGGDSAAGQQPGTRVAGTLAASAGSGGLAHIGQSASSITSRVVEVVSTLQGGGKRGYRVDAEGAAGGHVIPVTVGTLDAHEGPHGHGGPNVQSAFAGHYLPCSRDGVAYAASAPSVIPIAVRGREGGAQMEHGEPGDPAFTVRTPAGGSSYPMVAHAAVMENQRGEVWEAQTFQSLNEGGGKPGQGYPAVRVATAVRRLTPRECERLQGFPDDWTEGQSDSARYRQLGNAVAVPVVEWIARRIVAYDSTSNQQTAPQEPVWVQGTLFDIKEAA